jgi:hypothetical protein
MRQRAVLVTTPIQLLALVGELLEGVVKVRGLLIERGDDLIAEEPEPDGEHDRL